jgi:pyruvate dehydrogenase E2 component (dihydrolipoamide acetyltransferase)
MRKTIARRLVESKTSVPHFYLDVECRVEALLALREQVNQTAPKKISINDFIVKAVAVALRQVPAMNVTWTDTALRRYHQADVCVAVSTDSGLITPVVRNADSKALSQISAEVAELAGRARDGRLRPDEYQGGSFTISNLGMYGVEQFSAIINPPHAAILAVGATQQKPVVENGELKVGSVLRCTLSVDHRSVDGAVAAQWLMVFKGLMENPLGMLI